MARVLVDTNILLAIADRNDREHGRVVRFLETCPDELVVPMTVLPEADYLISMRVGARAASAVLESILQGEMRLEPVTSDDLPRILMVMRQYADANIGLVDASIVAVAERLGVRSVLTLDRRHFGPIRPAHCEAFDLVP